MDRFSSVAVFEIFFAPKWIDPRAEGIAVSADFVEIFEILPLLNGRSLGRGGSLHMVFVEQKKRADSRAERNFCARATITDRIFRPCGESVS